MADESIRMIQKGLAGRGFNPGPADGIDGPKTRSAAGAYSRGEAGRPAPIVVPETDKTIYQGAARHPVREVIVHCSATRPDWMEWQGLEAKRAEIRRWHLANGWSDIGYHWLIDRDGTLLAGRPETQIGAHVVGRNQGTIGVCLIGGHGSSETDRAEENFTPQQLSALRSHIRDISMRTQIAIVSGHNQYAAKACPGFHVPTWFRGA